MVLVLLMDKKHPKMIPFGPLKLKRETVEELRKAAIHRTEASIVRELVEAWAEARKKKPE